MAAGDALGATKHITDHDKHTKSSRRNDYSKTLLGAERQQITFQICPPDSANFRLTHTYMHFSVTSVSISVGRNCFVALRTVATISLEFPCSCTFSVSKQTIQFNYMCLFVIVSPSRRIIFGRVSQQRGPNEQQRFMNFFDGKSCALLASYDFKSARARSVYGCDELCTELCLIEN